MDLSIGSSKRFTSDGSEAAEVADELVMAVRLERLNNSESVEGVDGSILFHPGNFPVIRDGKNPSSGID
jgi:hypothetical protein